MKDSARTKQDESNGPVERPTWRFTGRRGTPVHLRDQAPQTLPPEIRKAVTQLARERAGESAPAADAKPVRAVSDLKLGRSDGQAPPVAGASLPVERRNRSERSEPSVPTSHIPAATAPIAEPVFEPIVAPAVEPLAEPVAAAVEASVVESVPEEPVAEPMAEPVASATPEPVAETTPEPVAEIGSEPAAAADTAEVAEESKPVEASKPTASAKRAKLSAADRKKLAKSRAKAKAKAERAAKKDSDGDAAAEKARRLFARGRDIPAEAAATVEPVVEPVVEPTMEPANEPANEPAIETPQVASAAPVEAPDEPASPLPAAETAPEAETADSPAPPIVSDLPDVIPSLDAIDIQEPLTFPTLEPAAAWGDTASTEAPTPTEEPATTDLAVPASIADVDLGAVVATDAAAEESAAAFEVLEPALAMESASQAAWELGRLPFLVHDPTPEWLEPASARQDIVWDVEPAAIARPARTDETAEPAAVTVPPSIDPVDAWVEAAPQPATLRQIDWLPVGVEPAPAPIEIDLPRRAAPDAIQRLDAPLEVPRPDHALARAGAREGMTANARTAEARRRIARRRAELDEVVESLVGLGSGRRPD